MNEFNGTMKITPKYGKCDPLFVKGHWVKKDIGKPFMVWCNERTQIETSGRDCHAGSICSILCISVNGLKYFLSMEVYYAGNGKTVSYSVHPR